MRITDLEHRNLIYSLSQSLLSKHNNNTTPSASKTSKHFHLIPHKTRVLWRHIIPFILFMKLVSGPRDWLEKKPVGEGPGGHPLPADFLLLLISAGKGRTKTGHMGPKQRGRIP